VAARPQVDNSGSLPSQLAREPQDDLYGLFWEELTAALRRAEHAQ